MSFLEQLSCKRKKCAGELMVPIKLFEKAGRVIVVARCPRCHESYKRLLPMSDKQSWLPYVARPFFQCDVCGAANEDNYRIIGGAAIWHAQRLKILTVCKNCRKKRAKVISQLLWNDFVKEVKGPTEVPPTEIPPPEENCPHCGATISVGVKVCPSCKKEVICGACGALIAPGAMFCSSCGDKVETVEVPTSSTPLHENLCPTCQEEIIEGSNFCPVCGQELVCDKCGHVIREGALFCTNCGDAVTKGDLSE